MENQFDPTKQNDQGLHDNFVKAVIKLQDLQKKHGFEYEEKCQSKILATGLKIKSEGLIELCQDQYFARQICIKLDIPREYWEEKRESI